MPTAKEVDLETRTFELSLDGRLLPIFYAGPSTQKKLPALILVHEIFGVNDHIRDLAQRFARLNLRVFAPDIFALHKDFPQNEKERELDVMRNIWMSIPDSDLISDLTAAFNHVMAEGNVLADKVGAIGYCMGGAIAFMLACSEPRMAFVIDYYGRIKYATTSGTKPKHPYEYASSLRCPLLGLFSGIDELIPAEHINLLCSELERLQKSFQVKTYKDAPHAFFNDQRPHYHAEAANDAWQLTVDFINKHSKEERSGPY